MDVAVVGAFFFFKQKTAYEMRISDWSSDVCSSDLPGSTVAKPASPRSGGESAVRTVPLRILGMLAKGTRHAHGKGRDLRLQRANNPSTAERELLPAICPAQSSIGSRSKATSCHLIHRPDVCRLRRVRPARRSDARRPRYGVGHGCLDGPRLG